MKRAFILILALLCALSLIACSKDRGGKGDTNGAGDEALGDYYFSGKVIEIYETRCLLEVTDTGNGNFTVGDSIVVNTSIENCPKYDIGDTLTVVFDGKVALSYPAQVLSVYRIIKK